MLKTFHDYLGAFGEYSGWQGPPLGNIMYVYTSTGLNVPFPITEFIQQVSWYNSIGKVITSELDTCIVTAVNTCWQILFT